MTAKSKYLVVEYANGEMSSARPDNIFEWAKERGIGFKVPANPRKSELRCEPELEGFWGPGWDGDGHPIRYESWAAFEVLSW
jgi:hypothetical protein